MENPFETLDQRLSSIEKKLIDISNKIDNPEKNHNLYITWKTTNEPVLPSPEKELMTVKNVSHMLNISKGTIYNMTSARKILFFKKCGRIYFDRNEIGEWIRDDRRKTLKQLQIEAELEFRK